MTTSCCRATRAGTSTSPTGRPSRRCSRPNGPRSCTTSRRGPTSARRGSIPTACLRVNVEGTAHVLDAARACGSRRVLVVGSSEEYGKIDRRRARDCAKTLRCARSRRTARARSRRRSSRCRRGWERARDGARAGVLAHRRGTIRPVRRSRAGAAHRRRASAAGDPTIGVGNQSPVRDLSDVRDVVRAYRLLMEHGAAGEATTCVAAKACRSVPSPTG